MTVLRNQINVVFTGLSGGALRIKAVSDCEKTYRVGPAKQMRAVNHNSRTLNVKSLQIYEIGKAQCCSKWRWS